MKEGRKEVGEEERKGIKGKYLCWNNGGNEGVDAEGNSTLPEDVEGGLSAVVTVESLMVTL